MLGLTLTESEWAEEWSSVLKLASTQPRAPPELPSRRRSRLSTISEEAWDNPQYESLEEIHVLVLAHVIRRPIIIVADLVLKVSQLNDKTLKWLLIVYCYQLKLEK